MRVFICSLRYPACNAHAPYCHLWPDRLYNIFPHYLINSRLKKKLQMIKCVLIFSTTFVWNIYHSKKKWVTYDQKMYIGVHVKYPLFLSDFNETWIFSKDFQKIFKNQILWTSVKWEPKCSMRTDEHMDWQPDRYEDSNSHFSQFCKTA